MKLCRKLEDDMFTQFLIHLCLIDLDFCQFHLPMSHHGFPSPGLNLHLEPSEFQAALQ